MREPDQGVEETRRLAGEEPNLPAVLLLEKGCGGSRDRRLDRDSNGVAFYRHAQQYEADLLLTVPIGRACFPPAVHTEWDRSSGRKCLGQTT